MNAGRLPGPIRSFLRRVGIDPDQCLVLINLFNTLGKRQELTGQLGVDQYALQYISFFYFVSSVFLSLIALGRPPLQTFSLLVITLSSVLLLMMILMEAANTFLNPSEAAVLAHQPIRGETYFAAKLTYLLLIVGKVVLALNAGPAFAGLYLSESRWFYPIAHLFSAYLAGVFIALVSCAVFGVLIRFVRPAQLKNAAVWMQLLIVLAPQAFSLIPRSVRTPRPDPGVFYWSAFPLMWFAALAMAGSSQESTVHWKGVALGVIASAGFIVYGIRSLSLGYMTRVVSLLRSTGRGRARRPRDWAGSAARAIAGRPSGRAAFSFFSSMILRDWQFRRTVIPSVVPIVFLGAVAILRGADISVFTAGRFSPAHFLPHLVGFLTLFTCGVVAYSDQHKAAWIFLTVPFDGIRSFVRGAYWSMWSMLVAAPLICLLPIFTWYWRPRDAVLFIIYSLTLCSFYLGLQLRLVDGLPFANPPKTGRMIATAPLLILGPVVMGIAIVLQWLLTRSPAATIAGTIALAIATFFITRLMFDQLEARAKYNLYVLAAGRSAMFREVE